jgi:ATP-dependent Clp protease adaptor protein ClpS
MNAGVWLEHLFGTAADGSAGYLGNGRTYSASTRLYEQSSLTRSDGFGFGPGRKMKTLEFICPDHHMMSGGNEPPDPPHHDEGDGESKTGIVTKTRPKTKKPNLYKVLLLNDDFTPMEFVVLVLQRFFNKGQEDATRIMLHVHRKGVGICGVYTYEVAETKVTQVMDFSRQHGHPLQCTMEKE